MSTFRCGVAILALVVAPAVARAGDDSRTVEAKQHYEAGMAHYHLEEWDQAIAEFEAGFRLRASPEFLFNIAQSYRLSSRPDKAIAFYQKYLRMSPDAANRDEVERLMEQCRQEAQNKPATPPPAPKPAPVEPAPNAPSPTVTTTPATQLTAQPIREHKPVYKKGWFWGVMTGVVVVAAGAVVLGVVLSSNSSTTTLPLARF